VLIFVGHLCLVATVLIGDITDTLMSSIIQRYLIGSVRGVLITGLLDIEDGALIVIVH